MRNARTFWLVSLAAVPLLATSTASYAGGVGAGTLIENTAQASYETAAGPETVSSNTVTLTVDELLDVAVTSLDTGPVPGNPGSEILKFEVTNTGNGPEAFTLSANPSVSGNDFDTVVNAIAVDTNGNGTYDDGIDAILTSPSTTAILAADATLTVFVLVTVPNTALDTQESRVELVAAAVTGNGAPGATFAGAGENGSNAVVGLSGASAFASGGLVIGIATVTLVKSATIADPFGGSAPVPGAIITYTIQANVAGSGSVDQLVVTDAFPAETTYVTSSLALEGGSLTDAPGDDAGEATTTGISVNLGTVSAGSSQSITFNVMINQ